MRKYSKDEAMVVDWSEYSKSMEASSKRVLILAQWGPRKVMRRADDASFSLVVHYEHVSMFRTGQQISPTCSMSGEGGGMIVVKRVQAAPGKSWL